MHNGQFHWLTALFKPCPNLVEAFSKPSPLLKSYFYSPPSILQHVLRLCACRNLLKRYLIIPPPRYSKINQFFS